MKIYTKTGDGGETGLYGGGRIAKDSIRIAAIGDVDELNSVLGLCRVHSCGWELDPLMQRIQNWLFDLGAELATPSSSKFSVQSVAAVHAKELENSMDAQSDALPPLKSFILPGGSQLAASLHHARSVCRRAERTVLQLDREEAVRSEIKVFLNRLSDWLFLAARTANASSGVHDISWSKSEGI